jgi:hypothetical protein
LIAIAAALLLQQPTDGDTIVVTAERTRCTVRLADKPLSDPEFAAHAREWAAGRTLRVYAPSASDEKCLARIVFKLNKKGVRVIHFVDGSGAPRGDPNWGPPDKP